MNVNNCTFLHNMLHVAVEAHRCTDKSLVSNFLCKTQLLIKLNCRTFRLCQLLTGSSCKQLARPSGQSVLQLSFVNSCVLLRKLTPVVCYTPLTVPIPLVPYCVHLTHNEMMHSMHALLVPCLLYIGCRQDWWFPCQT